MNRPRELLTGALLAIASLGLLEGAARLFYHPVGRESSFEFDANKNYRWKASYAATFGTQKFRTNSQNRVGRELPYTKPSGSRRLAVLGDSVSFGFNVPYEQTYVPLLESKLGVEAINFSVPGYATFQEFYDLQESKKYCPNVTLLQFSFNDLVEPFLYLRRLGGLGIDYHLVPDASGLHFRLRSLSKLYELASDTFVESTVRGYGREEMKRVLERNQEFSEREFTEHPHSERGESAWKEFDYWLHRMKCEGECVFFLSPHSMRFYEASVAKEQTVQELRSKAESEGFVFFDPMKDILAKLEGKEPVERWNSLFLDDIHPNAKGHEVLAGLLAEKLKSLLHSRVCP